MSANDSRSNPVLVLSWLPLWYQARGVKDGLQDQDHQSLAQRPQVYEQSDQCMIIQQFWELLLIKLNTHSGARGLNKLNTRGLRTSRDGCYDISSSCHNCRCRLGDHWFRAWTKSIGSGQKRIIWFVSLGYERPSGDTELMGGLIEEDGLSDLYWCDDQVEHSQWH